MRSKSFFSPTPREGPNRHLITQSQLKASMALREHRHFWTLDSSDVICRIPLPEKSKPASRLSILTTKNRSPYARDRETAIDMVYGGRQKMFCLSSDV